MEARWIGSGSHSVSVGASPQQLNTAAGFPFVLCVNNVRRVIGTEFVQCFGMQGDWSRASTVKPGGCEVGATVWAQVFCRDAQPSQSRSATRCRNHDIQAAVVSALYDT